MIFARHAYWAPITAWELEHWLSAPVPPPLKLSPCCDCWPGEAASSADVRRRPSHHRMRRRSHSRRRTVRRLVRRRQDRQTSSSRSAALIVASFVGRRAAVVKRSSSTDSRAVFKVGRRIVVYGELPVLIVSVPVPSGVVTVAVTVTPPSPGSAFTSMGAALADTAPTGRANTVSAHCQRLAAAKRSAFDHENSVTEWRRTPPTDQALFHRHGDAFAHEYRAIAADQLPHHVEAGARHEGRRRLKLKVEVRRACTTGRRV
jgi:hypothetical protein